MQSDRKSNVVPVCWHDDVAQVMLFNYEIVRRKSRNRSNVVMQKLRTIYIEVLGTTERFAKTTTARR